jgi:hypothetical protein
MLTYYYTRFSGLEVSYPILLSVSVTVSDAFPSLGDATIKQPEGKTRVLI